MNPTREACADVTTYMRTGVAVWKPVPEPRQPSAYELEQRAADQARTAAREAALETEAQNTAQQFGFDASALRFQADRYRFGSLAEAWNAPHLRAVYRRAVAIACERADQHQQAAE